MGRSLRFCSLEVRDRLEMLFLSGLGRSAAVAYWSSFGRHSTPLRTGRGSPGMLCEGRAIRRESCGWLPEHGGAASRVVPRYVPASVSVCSAKTCSASRTETQALWPYALCPRGHGYAEHLPQQDEPLAVAERMETARYDSECVANSKACRVESCRHILG